MKNRLIKFIFTLLALCTVCVPLTLAAATPIVSHDDLMTRIVLDPSLKPENSPGVIIGTKTLEKSGSETAFANYLLQVMAGGLISIAAPVAIIIIAISGLMAVVSHGDKGAVDKAKKTLTWAIIGLIVIIFAWVIVKGVISLVIGANSNPTPNTTQSAPAKSGDQGTKGSPGNN
jgi:hypothetical protein